MSLLLRLLGGAPAALDDDLGFPLSLQPWPWTRAPSGLWTLDDDLGFPPPPALDEDSFAPRLVRQPQPGSVVWLATADQGLAPAPAFEDDGLIPRLVWRWSFTPPWAPDEDFVATVVEDEVGLPRLVVWPWWLPRLLDAPWYDPELFLAPALDDDPGPVWTPAWPWQRPGHRPWDDEFTGPTGPLIVTPGTGILTIVGFAPLVGVAAEEAAEALQDRGVEQVARMGRRKHKVPRDWRGNPMLTPEEELLLLLGDDELFG